VVFPKGNEAEFVKMAKQLGIDSLLFVYANPNDAKSARVQGKCGLLVEPKNVRHAHDRGFLAVCGGSREALERGADVVFGFELDEGRDPTHFRASGLNQVLCKIAKEQRVRIGFSFAEVLRCSGVDRARLLGRFAQNIRLCAKYGVSMKIASFATDPMMLRSKNDLASFFSVLGMSAKDVQAALR